MKKINKKIHTKSFAFRWVGGFTLVEMLVVISIIAILSAVLAGGYSNSQRSARDAARKANLKSISDALNQYYADNGVFPNTIPLGGEFALNGIVYMKKMPSNVETGGMTPIRYDTNSSPPRKHFRLYTNLENNEDKACFKGSACGNYNTPNNCCFIITSSNLGATEALP